MTAQFSMRTFRLPAVAASLLVIGVLGLAPASVPAQDSIEDARTERETIRREAAEIAATIDLLEADDAEVVKALEDLATFIATAEADIDAATVTIAQAEAEADAAEAEAARLDDEIEVATEIVRDFAISAYVANNTDRLDALLSSDDPRTSEMRHFFAKVAGGSSEDAIAELRRYIDDQAVARREAQDARDRADEARVELEADRADLQAAVVAAEEVRADIEVRIDDWQGETRALQAADDELTGFILAEQARIEAERQAELARQREVARQQQLEQDRQREAELERERQEELERQRALEKEQEPDPDPVDDTTPDDTTDGSTDGDTTPDDTTDGSTDGDTTPDPPPPPPASVGFIWPINGSISSGFGYRIHPIFGTSRFHSGLDINGGSGTPIAASAAGTVISAGWRDGYGNTVVIDHGGGLATLYAHQSQIAVSSGQSVSQGEIIGYVGSTGWSTGPHLHFEIRVGGSPVDPMGYL